MSDVRPGDDVVGPGGVGKPEGGVRRVPVRGDPWRGRRRMGVWRDVDGRRVSRDVRVVGGALVGDGGRGNRYGV